MQETKTLTARQEATQQRALQAVAGSTTIRRDEVTLTVNLRRPEDVENVAASLRTFTLAYDALEELFEAGQPQLVLQLARLAYARAKTLDRLEAQRSGAEGGAEAKTA